MRDTYDKDPTTTSMYDDGHVYTDHAGSLKWKFAGGPAAEYAAATGHKPFALTQHRHHMRDSFDKDPTSASMYDDGHVYTDHAGSLKWVFAGGPAAEYGAATGHKPFALN
jgi:hypothetical protein